jgi:hypothetical protein
VSGIERQQVVFDNRQLRFGPSCLRHILSRSLQLPGYLEEPLSLAIAPEKVLAIRSADTLQQRTPLFMDSSHCPPDRSPFAAEIPQLPPRRAQSLSRFLQFLPARTPGGDLLVRIASRMLLSNFECQGSHVLTKRLKFRTVRILLVSHCPPRLQPQLRVLCRLPDSERSLNLQRFIQPHVLEGPAPFDSRLAHRPLQFPDPPSDLRHLLAPALVQRLVPHCCIELPQLISARIELLLDAERSISIGIVAVAQYGSRPKISQQPGQLASHISQTVFRHSQAVPQGPRRVIRKLELPFHRPRQPGSTDAQQCQDQADHPLSG